MLHKYLMKEQKNTSDFVKHNIERWYRDIRFILTPSQVKCKMMIESNECVVFKKTLEESDP